MTVKPLQGFTVGITAARRSEELGTALERRGATVRYAPAIRIVPLQDDAELIAATRRCLAEPLDLAVITTGIGYRGWVEAADAWGLGEQLLAVLGGTTLLARGPKVRGAIRASGLREDWSPSSESSSEVLTHLLALDLRGKRVAVQLHGEPVPGMVDALTAAGAEVIEVPVYRWVPPTDMAPLHRLVQAVADRDVDAVAFTSAPASTHFLRTAAASGHGEAVLSALRSEVVVACVGPVTAGPLTLAGVESVQPERYRLGALVREIVEQVPRRLTRRLLVGGIAMEVRGQGVVVDDAFVALSPVAMTVLRALAADAGLVVSRRDLLTALGDGDDEHAVEVAVGRLRTQLGRADLVETVVKRGYRLAVAR